MHRKHPDRKGALEIAVRDAAGAHAGIVGAPVKIVAATAIGESAKRKTSPGALKYEAAVEIVTGPGGRVTVELPPNDYRVTAKAFGLERQGRVVIGADCTYRVVCVELPVDFSVATYVPADNRTYTECRDPRRRGRSCAFELVEGVRDLIRHVHEGHEGHRAPRLQRLLLQTGGAARWRHPQDQGCPRICI